MQKKSVLFFILALLFLAGLVTVFVFVLPNGDDKEPPHSTAPTVVTNVSTITPPPPLLKITYPPEVDHLDDSTFDVRFSVDGSKFAYIKYYAGDDSYALCWTDNKTDKTVEIVRAASTRLAYPRWDSSGQFLAYTISHQQQTLVYVYDTVNATVLTPGGLNCEKSIFFQTVTPESYVNELLYKENLMAPYYWSVDSLLVLSSPGAVYSPAQKKLLADLSQLTDYDAQKYASLSPDQSKLAFMGYAAGRIDYVVVELLTGEAKVVYQRNASEKHGVEYLEWFNNSNLLIDVIDNKVDLMLLDIATGDRSSLYTYTSSAGGYCRVSPNREQMLIVDISWRNNNEITIVNRYNMKTGKMTRLFSSKCLIFLFGDASDTIIGLDENGVSVWDISGNSLARHNGLFFGAMPQIDKDYRLAINLYGDNSPPQTPPPPATTTVVPHPVVSLQDNVYKTAQSFASALRLGNTAAIELLAQAAPGTYESWSQMQVNSYELDMLEQEGAYGLFHLTLDIAQSNLEFFPAGRQEYLFTVNYSLYQGEIGITSIYKAQDAPYSPFYNVANSVEENAAALALNFFNFMGQLEFLSVEDLPEEVILDYAIISLAIEADELPEGFSPQQVNDKIAQLFGVYEFDGKDTYFYDWETGQYLLLGRGGYEGVFRMPQSRLNYVPVAGIFSCEIWFFADPLQTVIESRIIYTMNATENNISFLSAEVVSEETADGK